MASTNQLHVTNLFSMKDAVCLVTGGGTGIGLMATQALAANGKPPPVSPIRFAHQP
jgi:NADPH:quinone reductase-like Zn-dependent oxidoreductase